jgi:hypothetical protein
VQLHLARFDARAPPPALQRALFDG